MSGLKPVGRCIYCGRTKEQVTTDHDKLSDEHIIPLSLGGNVVLPEASCGRCRDKTHAFEGRCASKLYGSFRIRYKLPTRRKKKRAKELPMIFETGEIFLVPIDAVVTTLPVFYLLKPGYLRVPQVYEIGWAGIQIQTASADPADFSHWAQLPKGTFTVEQEFDVDSYARLMAKIAHAYCVAEFGMDSFEAWLPPYILGENPHLSYLVGGESPLPSDRTDRLSEAQWFANTVYGEWLLWVNIRLFTVVNMPYTTVIVGRTSEEAIRIHALKEV